MVCLLSAMKASGLGVFGLLILAIVAKGKAAPVDIYATEYFTSSCCAFSLEQHESMRGFASGVHDGSGTGNTVYKNIDDGCEICPPYTCRTGDICRTPEYFLQIPSRKCEPVFGKDWPQSANGTEDVQIRGCAPTPSPPKDIYPGAGYTRSCCEFTFDEHESMSWWHQGVRDGSGIRDSVYTNMDNSCEMCPPYTCRTGDTCRTPEYFLQIPSGKCETVFGKDWPRSADPPIAEDFEVRGCMMDTQPTTEPDTGESGPDSAESDIASASADPEEAECTARGSTANIPEPPLDTDADGDSEGPNWDVIWGAVGAVAGVVSVIVAIIGYTCVDKKNTSQHQR